MSKTVTYWGRWKCRVVKIHLNLRDHQLKIITQNIHIGIFKLHGNCKPKIYNRYTHKKEKGIQMQY